MTIFIPSKVVSTFKSSHSRIVELKSRESSLVSRRVVLATSNTSYDMLDSCLLMHHSLGTRRRLCLYRWSGHPRLHFVFFKFKINMRSLSQTFYIICALLLVSCASGATIGGKSSNKNAGLCSRFCKLFSCCIPGTRSVEDERQAYVAAFHGGKLGGTTLPHQTKENNGEGDGVICTEIDPEAKEFIRTRLSLAYPEIENPTIQIDCQNSSSGRNDKSVPMKTIAGTDSAEPSVPLEWM